MRLYGERFTSWPERDESFPAQQPDGCCLLPVGWLASDAPTPGGGSRWRREHRRTLAGRAARGVWAAPKRGHQWEQVVGALSRWKRPFEFPRLGTLVTLRKARSRPMLFSQPWGGFPYFQDDSAIAVKPVQEIARTNGPEMVQKRFRFRQDAWVLATYTTGSTGQRPWLR